MILGHLKNGDWHNDDVATSNEQGEFDREKSLFRDSISDTEIEKDRFHLYVSYACPWAHRTLITRALKGLEDYISVSVVHPHMLEHSWTFSKDFPASTGDDLYQKDYLYQIYQKHDPQVTTKVTVPVLWDKKTQKIINNESSEIIRIFNEGFQKQAKNKLDLYPKEHRAEIDKINEKVYEPINNGVYKTGFAKNQTAYNKAFKELFDALDEIDQHLEGRDFLVGEQITEADIRLITTLLRFDCVYYTHFKCNKKHIFEYKNLKRYSKDLFNNFSAIRETTNFEHIKEHYYASHDSINPSRVVPKGPTIDFSQPHNRG